MIVTLEKINGYKDYVMCIMNKLSLVRTDQLVVCITNKFKNADDALMKKMDKNLAMEILLGLQRQGEIYLSEDGWTMTKGMYWRLTDDRYRDNIRYSNIYKLPAINKVCEKYNVARTQCMWYIAANMPDAEDFAITESPWTFAYTTEAKPEKGEISKLHEVIYFPKTREDALCHILNVIPKIQSDNFKECIERIAIVENKNCEWKIPYVGFTKIYAINHDNENHLELIKDRSNEKIWKSYE